MERPVTDPPWRVPVGLVVAVIAAALLILALWQVHSLSERAGGSARGLERERTAVAFQARLIPLIADLARFGEQIELLRPPHHPDLRGRVDREVANVDAFASAHQAALGILPEWRKVRAEWSHLRNAGSGGRGKAVRGIVYDAGFGLTYRLEDVSGLEYETNRISQDLADVAFAKIPSAIGETLSIDVLTENAQSSGKLSIPSRVRLARLINTASTDQGDLDLSADEWPLVLRTLRADGIAGAAQTGRLERENATMRSFGGKLLADADGKVTLRGIPSGSATVTRRNAHATLNAALALSADVSNALDAQLAERARLAVLRTRYLYVVALLGAILVAGAMLLVAERTARRDRAALERARQESERLSIELAHRKAERALRLSEAQFRAVFEGAALGIAILDRNGAIVDANAVFRGIYGDNSAGVLERREGEFAQLMLGERDLFEFEQHVMTPDGREAWTDSTISLVNDDAGNPYFAICMFRDLTELKRSERRLLHDMTHDTLTGLPNRALFESKVREQFVALRTSPESSFAVLFVDLDRFKDINEGLGHDAGDFVISQAGHRLRAAIEASDVVARLGSDEFAVLVRALPDVLHVEVIARRVLTALAKPIALGNRSIFVSASVGIALGSPDYERAEDIMRDADIAMRHAKGGGGSRQALFDSRMHARAEKRLQLTTDLRMAIERSEFDVLYQPIVTIAGSELVGCEALLRWNHPVEGVVGPAEFMPLAEQTGLAVPVGRHVLQTVCAQLARWKKAGACSSILPLNVNVSAAELLDPDFETMLLATLKSEGIAPGDLMLEITESVVLDAGTRPNALVERLRGQGFGICIDDFGTGYSSLRYLQQFKVDAIKIDRSFIAGQDGDVASEPIVRTLMTLAEAFGVRVVAEGIETQRQCEVLRSAGCRYGQGYYWARAVAPDQLARMYPAVFGAATRPASA